MHSHPVSSPPIENVSVLAYELNSLALMVAAEAATLARPEGAPSDVTQAVVLKEMNELIERLRLGANTLRRARHNGRPLA